MSKFTLYLTHHSHTDLGYTHDVPIVRELQRRYIDEALDLADRYADLGDEATFRWTCEVTCIVEHWLRTASPKQIERFLAAAKRGQFEVCGLWANLTPLATPGQLAEMFVPLRRLRQELGLTVRYAMNSDVNGFSWPLTDLMLDAGIEGMTMSINEHFGGAPQPFPGLFRWQTPTGKTMPVWSGSTYAHTAWLGIGGDYATFHQRMLGWIGHRREAGWTKPWLSMQITHPGPQNDNQGPLHHLSPWVKEFNARLGDDLKLVITTPSRLFAAIQRDVAEAEIKSGEWNDWWSFGVGSTPYETTLFRRGTAKLEEADLLARVAAPSNYIDIRLRAREAFGHYIEHTWGADCSVSFPDSEDTRVQQRHKENFAYEAFSLARLLRRDGLGALADKIDAPAGPKLLVFNPTPHARRETILVPRRILEATNLPPAAEQNVSPVERRWPRDKSYQHFIERDVWGGHPVDELGPIELPPLGWKIVTAKNTAAPGDGLVFRDNEIGNGRVRLAWTPGQFGLSVLDVAGRAWAQKGAAPFGSLIAEEILGDRPDIMKFDDSLMPTTTRRPVWNRSVPIRRQLPANVTTRVERKNRSVTLVQEGSLPGTGGISALWRLSADHDDIEVEIKVKKLPVTRPHAIYFALPFAVGQAQRLAAIAGMTIDPVREAISNGCPWWSLQEGFAVGDAKGAAYVATPDAPMAAFQRLPHGVSQVGDAALEHEGFSAIWLYNNYWETNFKADDAGNYHFRVRLAFRSGAPVATELYRVAAHSRHPIAFHPLPDAGPQAPTWPAEGELLGIKSTTAQVSGFFPDEKTGEFRFVLTNPGPKPDEITLHGKYLRFAQARLVTPEGVEKQAVPVENETLRVTVPVRDVVLLSVATKAV